MSVGSKEKIKQFTEKEVNSSLIKKVPGSILKSRSAHPKLSFELDGKKIKYIKIPNPHRESCFWPSQSKRIAQDLKLSPSEYNQLINCPMSGSEFEALAKERFAE